jgi:hypothetical protein
MSTYGRSQVKERLVPRPSLADRDRTVGEFLSFGCLQRLPRPAGQDSIDVRVDHRRVVFEREGQHGPSGVGADPGEG